MQPIKRAILSTLRPATRAAVGQTLTTTTSNRALNTLTHHHHRFYAPLLPKVRAVQRRCYTSGPPSASPESEQEEINVEKPAYDLTFTCKPCGDRSTHRVSKQGYHKGTVLITCPGCKNRHVISDHLGIFMDKKMTLEDILKEKGESFQKGVLNPNGDIEIWPDADPSESEIAEDSAKIVGKPVV
ncbi:zf-DNL-domain-containing protein [Ascobolus immersus RN42]|uniref:Zf-DNL-domain-containing protein n=1 Tax=Ascobolus immersus RN42 TaxID=1160509 RepID=A0A3N4IIM9_ASCIM|nr:zf-DNL-domain-containing protein [Ascobolus immersus RN42]